METKRVVGREGTEEGGAIRSGGDNNNDGAPPQRKKQRKAKKDRTPPGAGPPPYEHGFAKAPPGKITRYLYVANSCDSSEVADVKSLGEIFGRFGKVELVIPFAKRGFAHVIMGSESEAKVATDALAGESGKKHHSLNRSLYIRFSVPRKQKGKALVVPDTVEESKKMPLPEGLILIPDFIDEEEEKELVNNIDSHSWHKDFSRRVQHYGYEFNYGTRNVDPEKPVPGGLPLFVKRILPNQTKRRGLSVHDATELAASDQVTVNEYEPGQGIRPHVDTPEAFGTHISSLSLLSDIVMDFRYPKSTEKKSIILPRRSLLVLTKEARYTWSHGIAHRSFDCLHGNVVKRSRRVSLTLRRILQTKMNTLNPLAAPAVERDYVHTFYERIATHFSHTRWNTWPHVVRFLENSLKRHPHPLVFDVGCGNGKYLASLTELVPEKAKKAVKATQKGTLKLRAAAIGIDRCENLVRICRERQLESGVGDALLVPFRSNAADVVLSIAVVHHLSTRERRKKALSELIRILREGGVGIVTAWAKKQPKDGRREFKQQDVLVGWQMPKKFLDERQREKMEIEAEIATSDDGRLMLQRYCHVFEECELKCILEEAANEMKARISVTKAYHDAGNWCIEFEKCKSN
eukprot:CAMPEP_0114527464 /NCGR_PEP_ID=MMETSP0109-20121206/23633_1 /TAXON_ID=29199 /ORGANISM="Chlorarachnion reptans, Strain CCCM449" /LENGTH=632 /DNA_ID=CAMNT_0001709437 /DNA_START=166 /DNA_END=2064 /DNA_ORIENTATION=-